MCSCESRRDYYGSSTYTIRTVVKDGSSAALRTLKTRSALIETHPSSLPRGTQHTNHSAIKDTQQNIELAKWQKRVFFRSEGVIVESAY